MTFQDVNVRAKGNQIYVNNEKLNNTQTYFKDCKYKQANK